jgi:hypothetical protein
MESAVLLFFLGAISALRSVYVNVPGGVVALRLSSLMIVQEAQNLVWNLADAKICTSLSQRSTSTRCPTRNAITFLKKDLHIFAAVVCMMIR